MTRRTVLSGTAVIALIAAGMVAVSGPALAADTATINGTTTYQTMAGFGASEAFGEADAVRSAPAAAQQQALDLLYSPTAGAGLTILRNEISADSGITIEPTAPSSPGAAPTYSPLGNDQGQEWFAQQIKTDGATGSTTFSWTVSGPAGACTVSYSTVSQWAGGFVASVTISNGGTSAINGWTLTFSFPGDQKITNSWNGVVTQSGTNVSIGNEGYNASIPAGSSTQLGFQGTWTSSDAAPTAFTLNGTACSL